MIRLLFRGGRLRLAGNGTRVAFARLGNEGFFPVGCAPGQDDKQGQKPSQKHMLGDDEIVKPQPSRG